MHNAEGFYAYKAILAPKNGTIASIKIPEKYGKYVWEKYLLKRPGDEITRFASEPVGFLFMMFASREEMKRVLIDEYENSVVVMQERN